MHIGKSGEREKTLEEEEGCLHSQCFHLFFPLSSIQPKLIRGRIGKIAINV